MVMIMLESYLIVIILGVVDVNRSNLLVQENILYCERGSVMQSLHGESLLMVV